MSSHVTAIASLPSSYQTDPAPEGLTSKKVSTPTQSRSKSTPLDPKRITVYGKDDPVADRVNQKGIDRGLVRQKECIIL